MVRFVCIYRLVMAEKQRSPYDKLARRRRGFQAASALVAPQVQKAAEGHGFVVSRLLTNWPEIAGENLASITRPVRVSHSRGFLGATLTVLTNGPSAPLVEMQLPQLRERVNACYGYHAVQKIVLTQTSATGFAEGQAEFFHAPPAVPKPDPQAEKDARRIAAGFDDPRLADAMARLALNISSRKSRKDNEC